MTTIPAQVPGSAYAVERKGRKWVIRALNDAAHCLQLETHTPEGFKSKGKAVEWVKNSLMNRREGRAPIAGLVAKDVYERVSKKATRTSSEKRDWVVTMSSGCQIINEVFGNDEAAARRYFKAHKAKE